MGPKYTLDLLQDAFELARRNDIGGCAYVGIRKQDGRHVATTDPAELRIWGRIEVQVVRIAGRELKYMSGFEPYDEALIFSVIYGAIFALILVYNL